MAVRIRLQRRGAKKRPFFRIVIAESQNKRNGKFIETIGFFDPVSDPAKIEIKEERAQIWMKRGAIPSDSVKTIMEKYQLGKTVDTDQNNQ